MELGLSRAVIIYLSRRALVRDIIQYRQDLNAFVDERIVLKCDRTLSIELALHSLDSLCRRIDPIAVRRESVSSEPVSDDPIEIPESPLASRRVIKIHRLPSESSLSIACRLAVTLRCNTALIMFDTVNFNVSFDSVFNRFS